ncbi:MAG: hypothetical protein GY854_31750 [Deltaproteobacteria bacterium]|nr:hypothetical protein [Deltaproteobacteria bacterium]
MCRKYQFGVCVSAFLFSLCCLSCGGSQADPGHADDEDYLASIVGEVDAGAEPDEEDAPGEKAYTGSTELTVNLRVVNDKNKKGSFKVLDAEGKVVVEKGKLGESFEIEQGAYTIEFKSRLVFGDPVYRVEDVAVEGKEMTLDETFPAGQLTLHTYRKNPKGKCKAVSFSVKSEKFESEGKELPGKGKTCKPIILEAGSYELLLNISKKKVQPVKIQVNHEQVSSAAVKLER